MLMHPYRDHINPFPNILKRIKFPLEEILDIGVSDYCVRIGIGVEYYVQFNMVYSCNNNNSISVPLGTEAVVKHSIIQDKYSMYCTCVAMIPKSLFVF